LSGTLAFDILDRLTGEWSVMDTAWGADLIKEKLIEPPFVWFLLNLLLWFCIGLLLFPFL
jgi:WD repeat-containing protein 35